MKNTSNQRPVIKCPHCGYEYLPGEIFMPNNFLGQPRHIVRDALGKILYEEYIEDKELVSTEKYVCDSCNKTFITEAIISFKTKAEEEELDFSSEFTSLI